ncbi:YcaO-like family protein [Nonomuraea rhizosphaerae]|uniref:YcaO-like family protein n=1 Tax=Nonomuraea rhizosphaerae TaxID=2665663 RepID=UPI001C5F4BD6|nr:YcaO-like family protein [Nonomuraea rhizosphaerae]
MTLPLRIAPGHQLYPGADGIWRCQEPDGRVTRILTPGALMRRLPQALAGTIPIDEDLADLLRALEERGILTRQEAPVLLADRVVHVVGDTPVADMTAALLQPQVKVVRGPLESVEGVDLVIACEDWLPDTEWQRIDRLCAGVPWHRCHTDGLSFRIGPCTIPGRTATYADTRARRLAAARLPDELLTLWQRLDSGDHLSGHPWTASSRVAAGLLADDALAVLSGRTAPSEGHQLIVGASLTRHPVLPLPRPGWEWSASPEQLVDPEFGLITRVVRERGALDACVIYRAYVAATDRFAPWKADRVAGGAAFDEGQARKAAIGEAVERYCGNAVPNDLIQGSYAGLDVEAIDPRELALYAPHQYAAPGFPFTPFGRELAVEWATGRDLAGGQEVLVPAPLVYLNHTRPPHTNMHANAGIAAGPSLERAERSALEELFERDAVTLWWLRGEQAVRFTPSGSAGPVAEATSRGLSVTFLAIPSPFGVPVIGAFLEDRARQVVAFGTACRADPETAAAKAFTEAVVSYTMSLGLLDGDAPLWRTADHPYRPFRADRSYRDAFRPDWHDLTDLELNLQLFLDPRMQGPSLDRLRDPRPGPPPEPVDPGDHVKRLSGAGLRAVGVDLTTPDVRATGLRVARVVVPGLYGNAPAAFPFLGGSRLGKAADELILDPLPFA